MLNYFLVFLKGCVVVWILRQFKYRNINSAVDA